MSRPLSALTTAAAGALCTWAAVENTALLRTVSYRVKCSLPEGTRILQVSDLHRREFGKHQGRLIRKVRSLAPTVIAVTGDLVSRTEYDFTEKAAFLRALTDTAPVVMVYGNHETDLSPEQDADLRAAAAQAGVILLENGYCTVAGIRFAGLTLRRGYYRGGGLLGLRRRYDCTAQTVRELLGEAPPDTVLLAHNPLFFPAYAQWGAALTLSGHVHGGSVRLPLVGGLLSPERNFFPPFDRGYYRSGDAEMVLSGGLGKPRLFNPPELCVIEHAE